MFSNVTFDTPQNIYRNSDLAYGVVTMSELRRRDTHPSRPYFNTSVLVAYSNPCYSHLSGPEVPPTSDLTGIFCTSRSERV